MKVDQLGPTGNKSRGSLFHAGKTPNTQLSGEDAEDHNVIHILTAGASLERP
ncbi:MAG: hypothetical protein JJ957_20560 [Pseudomonadales bacterium]|nr:hypothetical protein [Pseudomonadales bacterium]